MGTAGADALLALIRQKQDLQSFREQHWERPRSGTTSTSSCRTRASRATLPARLRHDPVVRLRAVHAVQAGATSATSSSPTRSTAARRDLRARRAAHAARRLLQVGGAGLRHREAHPAAARPGRLVQEHDRAAAEEGPRGLLATRREGALYTLRLDSRRATAATASSTVRARCTRSRCCSSRARRQETVSSESTRSCPDGRPHPASTATLPVLPQGLPRPDDAVRRRLEEGDGARQGASA